MLLLLAIVDMVGPPGLWPAAGRFCATPTPGLKTGADIDADMEGDEFGCVGDLIDELVFASAAGEKDWGWNG